MGFEELVDSVISQHFIELRLKYPRLRLTQNEKRLFVIRGELDFSASFENICIEDSYSIEIILPNNYPDTPPHVIELNNRIPPSYHMFEDGTLCLGAPIAVKKTFFQTPTLIGFVENNLIPYLYGYSYKCKYGSLPFGELSHGASGMREFYQDYFDVYDPEKLLGLLEILAKNNYRGHHNCPCLCGEKVRNCHGASLRELQKWQSSAKFMVEYCGIAELLLEERKNQIASMQKSLHGLRPSKALA